MALMSNPADVIPYCRRLDRRTAHRWVRSIGKRAGLGAV
jgi:hypothetical protein